jgi:type IX secretion system PorP/SprF family membrane protein
MKIEIKTSGRSKRNNSPKRDIVYRKYFLILILAAAMGITGQAQDFKYYTQYMFNGLAINPAYAGSGDYINITGDIREQWVGIKGAPSTQTLAAHAPVQNDLFGLGILIINDKVGVITQQEVAVNYSYKVAFPHYTLSLGLKLGFNNLYARYDQLVLDNETDENFRHNAKAFLPVFGFGAYLKADAYYAGFSIPHLYKFVHPKYDDLNINLDRLVFLTGGYLYQASEDFMVKPSILMKANFGSSLEFDFNANVYYKEDYCVGLSYKSFNSLALIFEYGIHRKYYIGYSYDMATTALIKNQAGTHEISFNIYLNGKYQPGPANPRYF